MDKRSYAKILAFVNIMRTLIAYCRTFIEMLRMVKVEKLHAETLLRREAKHSLLPRMLAILEALFSYGSLDTNDSLNLTQAPQDTFHLIKQLAFARRNL